MVDVVRGVSRYLMQIFNLKYITVGVGCYKFIIENFKRQFNTYVK